MKVNIVGNNLRYNLPKIQEEEGIGEKKDQASCNVRKLDRKACVSVGFISSRRKLMLVLKMFCRCQGWNPRPQDKCK